MYKSTQIHAQTHTHTFRPTAGILATELHLDNRCAKVDPANGVEQFQVPGTLKHGFQSDHLPIFDA